MRVELTKKAEKQLLRLNEPLLSRIIAGIEGLKSEPMAGDIKELKGQSGVNRLRVGDYRLLFTVDQPDCVTIFKIAPRGQAYKEKK